MDVKLSSKTSRNGKKKYWYLEWGKGPGERAATGIYIWTKPKNEIERNFNKEAMAILETKRADLVLDLQAVGSSHIVTRKLKANFLDYYHEYCEKNPSATNRALPNSFNYFKAFLKKDFISPIEVTENLAKEFRKYLMDNLGGQTPLDYFSRFKRVVEAAESDGYFKKNPVAKVSCQSHPSELKETLEPKEWMDLINLQWKNHEVKKAAVTSLYSAFRWCDVKKLKWWQVRTESNTIRLLKQSKTGVPLEIPLHPVVKAMLGTPGNLNDLIFTLPSSDGANKILQEAVNKAKIQKHITWHCLRCSVSDVLQDRGVDVITVAAVLGQTTAKYIFQNYKKRVKIRDTQKAITRLPVEGEFGELETIPNQQ